MTEKKEVKNEEAEDCGAGGEGDSSCAHGILNGDRNYQLYGVWADSDVTWLIRPPLTPPTQEGNEGADGKCTVSSLCFYIFFGVSLKMFYLCTQERKQTIA